MKHLSDLSFLPYMVSILGCLAIMITVDYFLGARAEHLNAWQIINRFLGIETGLEDCLTLRHLGVWGATALMLGINTILGAIIVGCFKSCSVSLYL